MATRLKGLVSLLVLLALGLEWARRPRAQQPLVVIVRDERA